MKPSSKLTAALAIAATAAAAAAIGPAQAGAASTTQRVVVLERGHKVFSKPHHHSSRLPGVRARRPITGARTVLPLLGQRVGIDRRTWLHVLLPGRPNGHAGWISPWATRLARTPWRILVRTSTRRVTVYHYGEVVRRFRAVVGKPSTPTPHGRFFVEETIRLRRGLVGAPYVLALSARSNVFEQFEGGPGQIALHGLGGVGGVPGTAVSHGCVRLANEPIIWLARRIGPGVRVTIVP
jgi:lipoprotein-anchoring transpeptidase ErfK/SrfK